MHALRDPEPGRAAAHAGEPVLVRSRDLEAFEALGCAAREPRASRPPTWSLDRTVAALRQARDETNVRHRGRIHEVPSRAEMRDVVDGIAAALFPTHLGRTDLDEDSIDFFVGSMLHQTMATLAEQARRALVFGRSSRDDAGPRQRAAEATEEIVSALPQLRRTLVDDLEAAHQIDGGATSLAEILLCSTGLRAVLHHRIAHALHGAELHFLARLVAELADGETGVHIHPAAIIGRRFVVERGAGVTIGETAIVGENVRVQQGVTLGAVSDRRGATDGGRRHPRIEDDVVLEAGATLLGPIVVGARAIVGSGACVTDDVPHDAVVQQASSRTWARAPDRA